MSDIPNIVGFHNFCLYKGVPLNIEIDFIDFFMGYFKSFKNDQDLESILEYLLSNMSYEEINIYWLLYIKDKKETLPIDE